MSAREAKALLEDRAFHTGGGQAMNAWERLLNLPWPSASTYREAMEDAEAGGDARLMEAVRAWARQHVYRMKGRRMGGGREEVDLRAAVGLPTIREEHEERAAFEQTNERLAAYSPDRYPL